MKLSIVILFIAAPAVAWAQNAAAQRFEVASIKPSDATTGTNSGIDSGHGRIHGKNVTLKRCIIGAYGIGPRLIIGGPDWINTDRFEILAKAAKQIGNDEGLMSMLQTLLAERFKLAMHREKRSMQAYILGVAKNGPRLEEYDNTGSSTNSSSNGPHALIDAKGTTMDHFAEVLSRQLDLPVVNQTGIRGQWNLKLEYVPESARESSRQNAPPADGPSIYTAIQEQLGLRLRAEKTPIEVLVIDHVEKPSEN